MALTRPRYSQIYDTDYKQSVRLATTTDVGNLLVSGNITSSVDSITVAVNDRILVKDQADAKQNGIYRVVTVGNGTDGTWIRALDADANDKVTSGMTTTISEGIVNSGKTFKLSSPDPITLGTTNLTFIDPFIVTASAGGSINQVQFNDIGGTLNGSPGLTFNKTSNVLTVSGNISATYVLGNGSQLVGLPAGYSNVQVATYLPTYTGVVTSSNVFVTGNIIAQYVIGDGSQLTGIESIENSTNSFVVAHSNGNVTVKGNLVPSANVTYDLGSPTQRWATGYFAGNTLDLGGAQISVNPVTGTFTFTGNGVSTNLGGSSAFNPQGNVNVGGDLIVGGAVYIAGNTSTISTENVVFSDALIYLANGNPTDFLDIGFIGNFTRSALYSHTGFARDATDGVWKLFEGVEPEPTTVIDFGSASYSTALIGNLVTRSNITVGGNTRLGGALLTSAGLGGDPGQYLSSTGTGVAWTTIEFSSLTDGTNTFVNAEASNVNISINTTAVASFGETSLSVVGNVHATQFIGNGSQLTGLPEGYSNVQVATYLPTYIGTIGAGLINSTGNVLAQGGILNSLTVNGSITSTGFINTSGNISAGGNVTVANLIVSTGSGQFNGPFNESTTTAGVFIGNTGSPGTPSPRIGFFNGTAAQNWQIDNFFGTFRWYTPGVTQMTLNSSGTLTVGNILPTANNVSNIGSSTSKFNTVHAKATQAQYADLAEVYTSDQQYPAGTVVVFGGDAEVTQSRASHDTRVAGVVSTNPAYLMNSTAAGVPVALQGRVPCRVLGPVEQGDRVVSSHIPGVAQRLDLEQYQPGCIIGKALQAVDSTDISIIEVVVGRV